MPKEKEGKKKRLAPFELGRHFLLTFRPQLSKLLAFFLETPFFLLKVPKGWLKS